MNIEWSYAKRNITGYQALLKCYKHKEFDSPKRSTVPLLAYWRTPDRRANELSKALNFPLSDSLCLDFEHTVPVQRGKGKASCTDLVLTSGGVSLGIEAKWTEGRYEDVATWLRKPPEPNRINVMEGWLDLLRCYATTKIDICDLAALPYQMIHRAASVCYSNAESCWLVYQVFNVDSCKRKEYLSDLQTLATLLESGPGLRFCLVECRIEPTHLQIELERKWAQGERYLHEPVLNGLRTGNLLDAHLDRVECV